MESMARDDDLFMDDFLFKDSVDQMDHVDSLLLGFGGDAPELMDNVHVFDEIKCLVEDDGSRSPTTTDDMSDGVTDEASSEISSPPPNYQESVSMSPQKTELAATPSPQSSMSSSPSSTFTAGSSSFTPPFPSMLPYALPVAYFPPLNMNQKRPFPEVLPSTHTVNSGSSSAAVGDATVVKKSKREIRQMKNRESANKSRLRRKAQLSDLMNEVQELTNKQNEQQTIIAALRAENKSLHDQNAFLRTLVSNSNASAASAISSESSSNQELPIINPSSTCSALSAMENGQSMVEYQEVTKQKAPKRSTTMSVASLGLCATVFGVTLFADYEGGGGPSNHIRRPGRVLHSLPATVDSDFSPAPYAMSMECLSDFFASTWTFLSSSELAFGVYLNVVSFFVIMGLHHMWQMHFAPSTESRTSGGKTLKRKTSRSFSFTASETAESEQKSRSSSWQDLRLRDKPATDGSSITGGVSLSRVRVLF